MKQFTKFLFVLLAIVLLLQVIPATADGPDHRPETWELTATADAGVHHPARPSQPQPTATAIPQPYPIETPDPYPMPDAATGFIEWLRNLIWKAE